MIKVLATLQQLPSTCVPYHCGNTKFYAAICRNVSDYRPVAFTTLLSLLKNCFVFFTVFCSQFYFYTTFTFVFLPCFYADFSALLQLVGHQEEHLTCKKFSDEVLA